MLFVKLVLVLCGINYVLGEKKICNLEDQKCLTDSAGRSFIKFISGIEGVDSSDPISLDLIEANLPELKYKLINASLSGMLSCKVELAKISIKDLKYNYNVGCPQLVMQSVYEMKGKLGLEYIEGSGTCNINVYDYHFLFDGSYEKFIDPSGRLHLLIQNHILKYEAKGKVNYDCKNLFNGDKEKSDAIHKYANENWSLVHKLTRQPAMEAFMNKFIENVNGFLRIVPIADLFYEES